jgi:hypothetical protein
MLLRKQAGRGGGADDREPVAILAEPLPGHHDAEIAARLRDLGARAVEVLAPGFVSATLARGRLSELDDIASVGIKPRKRPLGGAR